jgi:putative acetyltransferase
VGVAIAVESPLQDEVRELVAALNAYLNPLSPRAFQFQMTVEQMADNATTLFVARDDSRRALGMGALKIHSPELGEIKRMYTRPEARGRRIGSALLAEITALAESKAIPVLMLETGEAPGFERAWRLYERAGFTQRGAYLDYPDSGWSRFYEKRLRTEAPAA